MKILDKIPKVMRDEVEKQTNISEAEAIPVADGVYDLVIGKSVPYSSREQLAKRIHELLRVGKEVRLYPITAEKQEDFDSVIQSIRAAMPVSIEFKTTTKDDVQTESGTVHVEEAVLILGKR